MYKVFSFICLIFTFISVSSVYCNDVLAGSDRPPLRGTQNSPAWTKPTQQNGGYRSEKGDQTLYGKNANSSGVDRSNHTHFHKDGVTVTHDNRKTTVYNGGSNNPRNNK